MYFYDKSVDLKINGYLRIKYLYQNCVSTNALLNLCDMLEVYSLEA